MTPILIISYYFPPLGGAGTQRFAKFVKWLPSFGYRPIVVTAGESTSVNAPNPDESLLSDLPSDAEVIRVETKPTGSLSMLERAALKLRFRVDLEEWVAAAMAPALDAARRHRVQAAIVTVSPYAAARIGLTLSRKLSIPWLLDLRDPWALDGWRVYPTKIHAARDLAVMKRALRGADIVVANTPAVRREYIRVAGLNAQRIVTIPNGFDPDDFAAPRQKPDDAHFRMVHVGHLHDPELDVSASLRDRLRFAWREIEPTGRSARYLYEAIAKIKRDRPRLFDCLRLECYGHSHANHRKLADRLGISSAITVNEYVPHAEAIRALSNAHAVFVPLHDLRGSDEALVVPGKLYEAIASERYVLGCVPNGDAARLIRLTGAGDVCPPTDVDAIARTLTDAIQAWQAGHAKQGASRSVLEPFARRNLTARLARALDMARGVESKSAFDDPWDMIDPGPALSDPVDSNFDMSEREQVVHAK